MTLNENAPLARLYRWFYLDDQMPKSLCPYFWKLVLMWIAIIPVTLFSIPTFIMAAIFKDPKVERLGERIGISTIIWLGLWVISTLIVAIISFFVSFQPEGDLDLFAKLGYVFWVVIICVILYHQYRKMQDKRIEKKRKGVKSEPKVSIVKEFIKATYNKYCPRITWEK
jgi:hypothetical protein